MSTRTACVVAGATPGEVAAIGAGEDVQMRVNRHGTLVTGRPGGRVIDYAAELAGPVYDVMYNPDTGWFVVTIYRQLNPPMRWDNRPGTNPGYSRVDDIMGASTPSAILDALDIPATAIGYTVA